MTETLPTEIGPLLRHWRNRRGLSQLALAAEADVSQKHLSFVESGRAAPSRGMILRLCDHLDLPLRDRNAALLAGGFAPAYPERDWHSPDLAEIRAAVDRVLAAHAPLPALAVDRHWTLVAANAGLAPLLEGIDPALMHPPVNVLRISLHPKGLAPRILNLAGWRAHVLERLRRQHRATRDPALAALAREIAAYPAPPARPAPTQLLTVPLRLRGPDGVLSFLSTTTVFGTAAEVTTSELAIEAFFPADAATSRALGIDSTK